jgi:fumarate hydratase class II
MRKRSKYRPKGVRLDAVSWVINGMKPVTVAKGEILTLRIKNHMALDVLRTGGGGKSDMDVVIAALNMTEALARLRIGSELTDQIKQAS